MGEEVGLKRGNPRRRKKEMILRRRTLTGIPMEKRATRSPNENLLKKKRKKKMVLRKMERKKLNLKDLREIPEVGLEKSQENPKKKRIRRNLRMSKLEKG